MTNSTPKNNKIERQGSPNGKRWSPQKRKSVTYYASSMSKDIKDMTTTPDAQTTPAPKKQTSVGRQSCSPNNNKSAYTTSRSSPLRHDSPRGSPTSSFYAGAKFSEPPPPATLPKPPSHWTDLMPVTSCGQQSAQMTLPCNVTEHFSKIINVQA